MFSSRKESVLPKLYLHWAILWVSSCDFKPSGDLLRLCWGLVRSGATFAAATVWKDKGFTRGSTNSKNYCFQHGITHGNTFGCFELQSRCKLYCKCYDYKSKLIPRSTSRARRIQLCWLEYAFTSCWNCCASHVFPGNKVQHNQPFIHAVLWGKIEIPDSFRAIQAQYRPCRLHLHCCFSTIIRR